MEAEEMCDICDKLISAQSLQMHKIHCERNTIKCEICQKKVSRFEKDKHDAEEHSAKQCEFCQVELEASLLLAHVCMKRPTLCEFCEASYPADQLTQHRKICGSRTEKCEKCGKFIMKIDFNNHSLSNCRNYKDVANELKYSEKISEKINLGANPNLLEYNPQSKSDDLFSPLVAASRPMKFGQQVSEEKQISSTSTSFFDQIPRDMYEEGLKAEAEFSVLNNNWSTNSMFARNNENRIHKPTAPKDKNNLDDLEQELLDAAILNSLNEI